MSLSHDQLNVEGELIRSTADFCRPRMTDEQREVLELIYDDITLDDPSFNHDILAPTPLDGEHLFFLGKTYSPAAIHYMENSFNDRILETGAQPTERQTGMIMGAIATEHYAREQQNMASLYRLQQRFLKDPSTMTLDEAQMTYRARSATASQFDHIQLLTSHPEIGSIETTKYTKPLDNVAVDGATREVFSRLLRVQYDVPDFTMRILSADEQKEKGRFVNLGDLSREGVVHIKKPIIEALYEGVELIMKMRESMFLFPPDQPLGDVEPMIGIVNGKETNVQRNGFTTYWTLKAKDISER